MQVLPGISENSLDPIARRVEVEQGRVLGLAAGATTLHDEAPRDGSGH